jgi:hypothetical protein
MDRRALAVALLINAGQALAVDIGPKWGLLKSTDHVDGCVCAFYAGGDEAKPVLVADFMSGPAWLNLGGKDVKGKLVKEARPKELSLNSSITRVYEVEGCTVVARYRVASVCEPDSECDGYEIRGTVSVSKAGQQRSVVVRGGCGC